MGCWSTKAHPRPFSSYLLWARHQARFWGYNSEQDRPSTDPVGLNSPAFFSQLGWVKTALEASGWDDGGDNGDGGHGWGWSEGNGGDDD